MTELLDWYGPRRLAYPWRAAPSPYGVLVAEVMLQQTQVARVVPSWERFMGGFPSVSVLAAADLASVLRAWAGLGYNRRAAALHRSAGQVVAAHGGIIPSSVGELRRLPGVGAYTAAAVASCAYGVPVAAVDVNVRRVVARARLGAPASQVTPSVVADEAQAWLDGRDERDPGAWNQALMDLGREHCRAVPRCEGCPLASACRFRRAGGAAAGGVAGTAAAAPAATRRPSPFAGSTRQLRGRIVEALRQVPSLPVGELAGRWAESGPRVSAAVDALVAEGLVALEPNGRVRLGG
ncbi:MAG TPA: A/G-specific adenine glycosylase [Actinomycetota bacterium]|nr:A/G-specific adenine glycosylase [Actinomycetota bacterium]